MRKSVQLATFAIIAAAMVALAPEDVLAQKKKKNANNNPAPQNADATEVEYTWLNSQKNLVGTIMAFDGNQSVTLRFNYTTLEPNPNYKPPVLKPGNRGYNSQAAMHHNNYQQYRNLHSQMNNRRGGGGAALNQQAMQAQMRMYQQMMQMQMQLMQAQMRMAAANSNPNNQPFKQVPSYKDFTLDLQDKVVYRKMYLPMDYDDQGNPKKYTTAEKTALRGKDKTKPGYTATAEDVQIGASATLYLTPPKKKSKSKSDDDDPAVTNHATVNMVVLTKEAAADTTPTPQPAKKKKKN